MLVLPQEVEVGWWFTNKRYYESKGYIFTGYGDKFNVNVLDLPVGSNVFVNIICDYCKEPIEKRYVEYLTQRKIIEKDCCKNCYPQKVKETNFIKYGKESINQYLSVKTGSVSQDIFDKRERNRWYALNHEGWKEIRIISRKDKLPSDEVVFLMIEFAKEYINEGHSWIHFDIDNNIIECSQFKIKCDFGKLRYIRKEVS